MADVKFRVWASIVATVGDEVKIGGVAVDIPLSGSYNSLEEAISAVEAILILMDGANKIEGLISYIRDEAEGNLRKFGCHRDPGWTYHETTFVFNPHVQAQAGLPVLIDLQEEEEEKE